MSRKSHVAKKVSRELARKILIAHVTHKILTHLFALSSPDSVDSVARKL